MSSVFEVRTRADDRALLETLAHRLVEDRLAACVHVRGPEMSVYRWEGDVVVDEEWELTAVTAPAGVEAVVATIEAAHTYDLPSVVVLAVATGEAYGAWVGDETSTS
jgi:periplasmic divalent cation tolerance protein